MSVYGEYTLRLLNTLRFRISYMRLFAIAPHNSLSLRQMLHNRSSASPQPGRPLGAAAEGREPPPGCGGATKMIRKMREEELIVYIYLKFSDKYRKYLNLTSYFYTQKKEQSPDILTQQISVDSDCANDGFEHPWVRVCKSSHR